MSRDARVTRESRVYPVERPKGNNMRISVCTMSVPECGLSQRARTKRTALQPVGIAASLGSGATLSRDPRDFTSRLSLAAGILDYSDFQL